MYIGAIITVAGESSEGLVPPVFRPSDITHRKLSETPLAYWPVLGRSVLERLGEKLCRSGVRHISVIPEDVHHPESNVESISRRSGKFWSAWESTVANYLNQGISTLLLVRLGQYAELDYSEFIQFHREKNNAVTQACGDRRPLDIVAVDAAAIRQGGEPLRSRLSRLINRRDRYHFDGYTNELRHPEQYRQLVVDALSGKCSIRPLGREVEPGFWLGDGAKVDGSSCVVGPTYVGAGVRVRNACTISGFSSIEQRCEVDCGTNVDRCSVFPGTYVGMGLNLKGAIVSGSHLFHLQRNVEVEIQDRRLIGPRFAPHRLVKNARVYIGGKARKLSETVLSTRSSRLASLLTKRSAESLGDCPPARRTRVEQPSPAILGEVE